MIIKDDIGNTILGYKPFKRVISTVPSITHAIYKLGKGHLVLAHTLFCIYPKDAFQNKPKIGGTKTLNINKIIELKPDLIIANKEENSKEQILRLKEKIPVFVSDVKTLNDNERLLNQLGLLLQCQPEAKQINKQINSSLPLPKRNRKILYIIWKDPWMTVGYDTFINDMIYNSGFENVMPSSYIRYPIIDLEDIKRLKPDFIFLSSEPFPFKNKHKEKLENEVDIPCRLVNGELFSWYGTKIIESADYFQTLNRL